MPADPQCTLLGIPEHLHTCGRAEEQEFASSERLYRRHQLGNRKLKMVINFKQMSVNREEFCHEVTDILNNSKTGDRYEGYGVVSFPVEAVLSLRHETPGVGQAPAVVATATVRHDVADEPCNYSHSVVHGSVDGRELALGQDLSHTARMRLRFQIWRFVTTEIPADMAGENLDDESWQ